MMPGLQESSSESSSGLPFHDHSTLVRSRTMTRGQCYQPSSRPHVDVAVFQEDLVLPPPEALREDKATFRWGLLFRGCPQPSLWLPLV